MREQKHPTPKEFQEEKFENKSLKGSFKKRMTITSIKLPLFDQTEESEKVDPEQEIRRKKTEFMKSHFKKKGLEDIEQADHIVDHLFVTDLD